jgi:23S rRNA (guanine745-N1)-methyltransferase
VNTAHVRYLACPVCSSRFRQLDGALRCANGHSFDVARQGYVNLLPGDARPTTADTAEMIEARLALFASGAFEPFARAVAAASSAEALPEGCVVDVGSGPGYYLAAALGALPERDGLALDISKHAARRAARQSERISAVVWDTWKQLPVQTGSAALVLDVFAPRNMAEFRRILHPAGRLIVLVPTSRHLCEIVEPLGLLTVDAEKPERLMAAAEGRLALAAETTTELRQRLTRDKLRQLVTMGPSTHHRAEDLEDNLATLPESVSVTFSAEVLTFTPV